MISGEIDWKNGGEGVGESEGEIGKSEIAQVFWRLISSFHV
jgi:hypothetical protein